MARNRNRPANITARIVFVVVSLFVRACAGTNTINAIGIIYVIAIRGALGKTPNGTVRGSENSDINPQRASSLSMKNTREAMSIKKL